MEKMRVERAGIRLWLVVVFALTGALSSWAFSPIPKASGKALGVTRGKSFRSGLVFVNGKCIEPPYVVERWGTGIRINGKPVTGQIVDWNEFLKTQADVKTVKSAAEPAEAASASEPKPVAASVPDAAAAASTLDALFDDDGTEQKPAQRKTSAPRPVPTAAVAKPQSRARAVATLALEGDFVPNDTTKAYIARINAERTKIDRTLRTGGFICFGDRYSRVVGDARTLASLLDALPEIQQEAEDLEDFLARARSANLVYLNEILFEELYRNRTDYRKLKELRRRLRRGQAIDGVLNNINELF